MNADRFGHKRGEPLDVPPKTGTITAMVPDDSRPHGSLRDSAPTRADLKNDRALTPGPLTGLLARGLSAFEPLVRPGRGAPTSVPKARR